MVSARLLFVVASAFAIQAVACGGSDPGSSSLSHGATPPAATPPGTKTPGATPPPSTSQNDAGTTPTGDAGTVTPDSGKVESSACLPYIGHWVATLDDGASVSGSDTDIVGGGPVPINGTIDFTLTHDDADYANILDFTGNATIKGAGVTIQQALQPATSPTGDPKDTTCSATGGLHFYGSANVNGIGLVDFEIVGTLDANATPPAGTGPFTMKTHDDNGAALSGSGNVHFVRQ
jgi:hypothetical protein